MSINLKTYWITLRKDLEHFDKDNSIKAKDIKDQANYQKQREFLDVMSTIGLDVEATNFTVMKASKGMKLKALPKDTFGDDQVVTSFDGPLSRAFAEEIYLPHLKRFNDVEVSDPNLTLRLLCNLPQQKQDALVLVGKLEAAIEDYSKKATSALVEHSVFGAVKKPTETEPEQEKLYCPK